MSQSNGKVKLKWHTWLLMVILVIWGSGSMISLSLALATIPKKNGVGLLDYYVLFSQPFLVLLSAYLLYIRSRWVLLTFATLSVLFYLVMVWFSTDQLNAGFDLAYILKSMAWTVHFNAMFFFTCLVYSAFLKKWGQIG
ncbi:MAG: hypothetical protein NTX45_19150 [Proteobacteria bacterium]|nr:hypothetical protein [Pseudomonadota bacterium]